MAPNVKDELDCVVDVLGSEELTGTGLAGSVGNARNKPPAAFTGR